MNRPLVDLFRNASEDRLRLTLDRLFPEEDTEELIAAFRNIREMDAAPNVELVLSLDRDEDDVLLGGTDPKTGVDYAMDLLPWAAYLALKVPDAPLEEFECEEMVGHVLGEMTFYADRGTPCRRSRTRQDRRSNGSSERQTRSAGASRPTACRHFRRCVRCGGGTDAEHQRFRNDPIGSYPIGSSNGFAPPPAELRAGVTAPAPAQNVPDRSPSRARAG